MNRCESRVVLLKLNNCAMMLISMSLAKHKNVATVDTHVIFNPMRQLSVLTI